MRFITSYGYRVQILFRLLRMARRLVEQLEIGHDIRFRRAGEGVAWLDVIQVEGILRHPAATLGTPSAVAAIDYCAQVRRPRSRLDSRPDLVGQHVLRNGALRVGTEIGIRERAETIPLRGHLRGFCRKLSEPYHIVEYITDNTTI